MGAQITTKKQPTKKGCVSISNYRQGRRLRRNYNGTRHELYVSGSLSNCERVTNAIKALIESDLMAHCYDESLARYKQLIDKVALQESTLETQLIYGTSYILQKRKQVYGTPNDRKPH